MYAVKPVNTAEFADSEEFQLVSHKLEMRYAVFLLLQALTLHKGSLLTYCKEDENVDQGTIGWNATLSQRHMSYSETVRMCTRVGNQNQVPST